MKNAKPANRLLYYYTMMQRVAVILSLVATTAFLMFPAEAFALYAPAALVVKAFAAAEPEAGEPEAAEPEAEAEPGEPEAAEPAATEPAAIVTPATEPELTIEERRSLSLTLAISPALFARGDAEVLTQFEPILPYDEDGFSGNLELVSLSYEPVYRIEKRQVERVVWYQGLPDEDIIFIPRSCSFEIASAESINGTTITELEMVAVEWTLEGRDAAGRPQGYTAEVTYRGVESALAYDHFLVKATYEGPVIKIVSVEPSDELPDELPNEPSVPAAPVDTIDKDVIEASPEKPPERENMGDSPLPLTIAATLLAAALFGCVAFALLFRYWNVRLIVIREDGSAKTILRRHVRLVDGTAKLTIPNRCAFTSSARRHLLRVKQSLVDKGGFLSVVWQNRLLFHLPLEREIDLQQRFVEITFSGLVAEDEIAFSDVALENVEGELA